MSDEELTALCAQLAGAADDLGAKGVPLGLCSLLLTARHAIRVLHYRCSPPAAAAAAEPPTPPPEVVDHA